MSWSLACAVSELEEDKPYSAEVDGELVAIVPHEGELFAIRDECSHGRVMLSLVRDETQLFKEYSDNADFKKWLEDAVFRATYKKSA